ncbi:hypothetical protein GWI33_017261 [Rhynchophorus ferrugineus]|uniref:Uncharacterized protein n=1 Tax=Rhynchophorus ferrugineus TaxID=354439 RepID=A0A834M458_RHYFE|nr:hypothetical protein GWI33_017261 [Rhynchophorus ferrugineus]
MARKKKEEKRQGPTSGPNSARQLGKKPSETEEFGTERDAFSAFRGSDDEVEHGIFLLAETIVNAVQWRRTDTSGFIVDETTHTCFTDTRRAVTVCQLTCN